MLARRDRACPFALRGLRTGPHGRDRDRPLAAARPAADPALPARDHRRAGHRRGRPDDPAELHRRRHERDGPLPELRQGARHLLPVDRLPVDDAQLDERRRVPHRRSSSSTTGSSASLLFELTDERWLLLVFPNTFEYFFIAYEVVRLRFDPAHALGALLAAPRRGHLDLRQAARRSTGSTSPSSTSPTPSATTRGSASRSRSRSSRWCSSLVRRAPAVPPPDWGWRFAADPLPSSLVESHARFARRLHSGRVLTSEAREQVGLLALLCIIFASILPGIDATALQVTAGVTAIVLANSAISLAAARRGHFPLGAAAARYAVLLAGERRPDLRRQRRARRSARLRPALRALLRPLDHDDHLAVRRIQACLRRALRRLAATRRVGWRPRPPR